MADPPTGHSISMGGLAEDGGFTPAISPSSAVHGAIIHPVYAKREVMHFAVSEHELSTLTLVNAQVVFCSSAATFLVGIGMTILIGIWLSNTSNSTTDILGRVAAPLILIFALAFAIAGVVLWRWRGGSINRIKRESGVAGL
jgi:apolipoprotein N-acyltransferase